VTSDFQVGAQARHANSPPLKLERRHMVFTFCAVLALTTYAPLDAWLREGLPAAFRWFADDAFYYLAIAHHSPDAGLYTFDGIHPTNGFHPLWQYLLTRVVHAFDLRQEAQVEFAFLASIALVATGSGFFAIAVLRSIRNVTLALLAAVPGYLWWIAPAPSPDVGAQWSFINGMESPLSIFLFGILAWMLTNRCLLYERFSLYNVARVSFVLSALTLSRLDDVFLFPPFLAFLIVFAHTRGEALRRAAVFCAIPALLIGGYLAFNVAYAGTALPVSGAAKAGGLLEGLLRNGYAVLTMLLPGLDVRSVSASVWADEAWRMIQMILPAFGALAWLVVFGPRLRQPFLDLSAYFHAILSLLASYVLLKAAYNFVFVGLWHQGSWYYPLSTMTFNWIVAALLAGAVDAVSIDRLLPQRRLLGIPLPIRPAAVAGCILLILVFANVFSASRARQERVPTYQFFAGREALDRELRSACPGCGVVAFDDGIVAYSLAVPTMNGIGLALDLEALRAKRDGKLLSLAWQRGYRLLVSVSYPIADDLTPDNLRQRLAGYRHLRDENLERWSFAIAHRDAASGAVFIRFEPRRSGAVDRADRQAHGRTLPPRTPAGRPGTPGAPGTGA
jgi:hypothetical protein